MKQKSRPELVPSDGPGLRHLVFMTNPCLTSAWRFYSCQSFAWGRPGAGAEWKAITAEPPACHQLYLAQLSEPLSSQALLMGTADVLQFLLEHFKSTVLGIHKLQSTVYKYLF